MSGGIGESCKVVEYVIFGYTNHSNVTCVVYVLWHIVTVANWAFLLLDSASIPNQRVIVYIFAIRRPKGFFPVLQTQGLQL